MKDEGILLMLFFNLRGTVSVVSFNARGAWGLLHQNSSSACRPPHLHDVSTV